MCLWKSLEVDYTRKVSWHLYQPRLRLQERAAWHVPWSTPDTPIVRQDNSIYHKVMEYPKVAKLAFAK